MKRDEVALLDSVITELVDALTPVRAAIGNVEVALMVLRRRRAEYGDGPDVDLPDLVDESRFIVRWKGAECQLGPTVMFRLFCRLTRPANHFVSVTRLSEEVWKNDDIAGTTVRSTIRRLRSKLRKADMGDLAGAIQVNRSHYGLMLKGLTQ